MSTHEITDWGRPGRLIVINKLQHVLVCMNTRLVVVWGELDCSTHQFMGEMGLGQKVPRQLAARTNMCINWCKSQIKPNIVLDNTHRSQV